ncbi:MAG: protease complex subunit PrcB family protein [Ezakiella sp.]|nr:protease complex subunit PrcB family protein [Ezakiella sp.]MDY3923316.1 protease complex subunit PrcB family protein [Ezakiella sp.]
MRNKFLAGLLVVSVLINSIVFSVSAKPNYFSKNEMKLDIDNKEHTFTTVMYKSENYVKLRDLLFVLMDYTDFSVKFNKENSKIIITTGKYEPLGDELNSDLNFNDTVIGNEAVSVNDRDYLLSKINVAGYNYFRLRDLAEALGLDTSWNKETRIVGLVKKGVLMDGKINFREVKSEETKNQTILLIKDAGDGKIAITYSVKVNTGGYSLSTDKVERNGNRIIITPKIQAPPAGQMVTQVISYPSTTIILDEKELPEGYVVEIEGQDAVQLSDR